DWSVTGVQTCALPICGIAPWPAARQRKDRPTSSARRPTLSPVSFSTPLVTAAREDPRPCRQRLKRLSTTVLQYSDVVFRCQCFRSEERRVGKECIALL